MARAQRLRLGDAGVDERRWGGGEHVQARGRKLLGEPVGDAALAAAGRRVARAGQGDLIGEVGVAPGERVQRVERESPRCGRVPTGSASSGS